jgi:hypothetical protein
LPCPARLGVEARPESQRQFARPPAGPGAFQTYRAGPRCPAGEHEWNRRSAGCSLQQGALPAASATQLACARHPLGDRRGTSAHYIDWSPPASHCQLAAHLAAAARAPRLRLSATNSQSVSARSTEAIIMAFRTQIPISSAYSTPLLRSVRKAGGASVCGSLSDLRFL